MNDDEIEIYYCYNINSFHFHLPKKCSLKPKYDQLKIYRNYETEFQFDIKMLIIKNINNIIFTIGFL